MFFCIKLIGNASFLNFSYCKTLKSSIFFGTPQEWMIPQNKIGRTVSELKTLPTHGSLGRRLTVSLQIKLGIHPEKPSSVLAIAPLISKKVI